MANRESRRPRSSMANLGILLIIAGVVILAFQYVNIDLQWLPQRWAELSWPLHIIVPGLALFALGLVLPDGAGEGLSGFGLIAAAVGTLLWYQDVTGTWASWAYAWALVFPAAGGLAGIIHGTLHANWRHVRESTESLVFGIVMFLILGFVFESWLGFEGFGLGRIAAWIPAWIPGAALLAVGLIVLLTGGLGGYSSRHRDREQQARHSESSPAPGEPSAVSTEPKHMETIMPTDPTEPGAKQP